MVDTLAEITSRLREFIREEGQEVARARADAEQRSDVQHGGVQRQVSQPDRPTPLEGEQLRKHHEMLDTYDRYLKKLTPDERDALADVIRLLDAARK